MNSVVIVDYNVGNIDSVLRAVRSCGGNALISSDARDFQECSHIILPGVGSFDLAYRQLEKTGLIPVLREQVLGCGVPLLGICVGMQLLASFGEEGEGSQGLDFISGRVCRIDTDGDYKLPHVGWNDIHFVNECDLFCDIPDGKDFYFVHSYNYVCEDRSHVAAEVDYSCQVTAAVHSDNIYGVQFHPEKSQKIGLQLLKNFIQL